MLITPENGPGTARMEDLPDLIHLWSLCFQENEAEAAYFPTHRFHPEEIFVWRRDGVVCAVIYLIPVLGKGCRGGYLYAIGTHPDLQGQGIFTQLHQYAAEKALEAGMDFLCLIPATPSLFSLYGRLGYQCWYERRLLSLENSSRDIWTAPKGLSMRDCTPEDFLSAEEEKTVSANASSLRYEAKADRLLGFRQHLHYDGFLKHCTVGNTSFMIAGSVEAHTLYLSQWSPADSEILLGTAVHLARQHSCNRVLLPPAATEYSSAPSAQGYTLTAPPGAVRNSHTYNPYAMGLWLSNKTPVSLPRTLELMYT